MASRTLLSPGKQTNWNTPRDLFDKLDSCFHFTCDIAADATNALCPIYYSEGNSFFDHIESLSRGDVCWCNPPYGRELIKWVEAVSKLQQRGVPTVMLLPARVDTQWFHKYIYDKDSHWVHFLEGRLKFINPKTGDASVPAAFPSMLVWFRTASIPFVCGPLPVEV